jgi:uncharacterized phage protein gp47/JayE
MLGVKRRESSLASSSSEDQNVKFSVSKGTLADKFPDKQDLSKARIPAGISVKTTDGVIEYNTSEDTVVDGSLKEAFVSVVSVNTGQDYNVGRSKLVNHSANSSVSVTNLKPIANGSDRESDQEYRFRLSNSVAASPTSNKIAVKLAALGNSDVANVELKEFSRGAGTFDVMLVPVGNTVSSRTLNLTQRAVESVSAFGVSPRVVQPDYVPFKISVQLIPIDGTRLGTLQSNVLRAKNAILDYFESITIGGELVINRLRSAIISSVTDDIRDIRIIELCIDKRPHAIRNFKLQSDQLFTPDNEEDSEAIEVL